MPVTVDIDARKRRVLSKVVGDVSVADILAAIDRAVTAPEFEPGFDVLSDHTAIGEPLTSAQLMQMVKHLERWSKLLSGARWAVVATQAASYGMMRMLAVYAEDVPLQVRVFRSVEQAEAWLAEPKV